MSVNANNLTEVSGLKAGQRVVQVDGKWVVVGVGGKTEPTGSGGASVDLSFVTATEDKILTGYVGADKDGGQVHGSMPIAQVTETDSKVTVSKGYLSETKEFTINNESGGNTPDTPSSGGTWEIYQIKDYIPANTVVEGYNFHCITAYADALNGTYIRKVKAGYVDRYINQEKRKVLLAAAQTPSGYEIGWYEMTNDMLANSASIKCWIICDLEDDDNYTFGNTSFDGTAIPITYSSNFNHYDASNVQSWWVQSGTGRGTVFYPNDSGYPISVKDYIPQTITANKVLSYSGDTPTVEDVDTYLTGMQYIIEVGKSYVVQNNQVIGHPCFMPDKRISLIMSGMDDYAANANGIYTQNDFMESSQFSTWSNSNGYTIKYDFSIGEWRCFAPNGNLVASGGYGNNPVGASWYEMVQWSGAEVTLELYTK